MEKNKRDDELMEAGTMKARRPPANATPIGGYVLVVDGKFKTQFESSKDAMLAGMELKQKYPVIRIEIFNAMERSYAPLALVEGPGKLGSQ